MSEEMHWEVNFRLKILERFGFSNWTTISSLREEVGALDEYGDGQEELECWDKIQKEYSEKKSGNENLCENILLMNNIVDKNMNSIKSVREKSCEVLEELLNEDIENIEVAKAEEIVKSLLSDDYGELQGRIPMRAYEGQMDKINNYGDMIDDLCKLECFMENFLEAIVMSEIILPDILADICILIAAMDGEKTPDDASFDDLYPSRHVNKLKTELTPFYNVEQIQKNWNMNIESQNVLRKIHQYCHIDVFLSNVIAKYYKNGVFRKLVPNLFDFEERNEKDVDEAVGIREGQKCVQAKSITYPKIHEIVSDILSISREKEKLVNDIVLNKLLGHKYIRDLTLFITEFGMDEDFIKQVTIREKDRVLLKDVTIVTKSGDEDINFRTSMYFDCFDYPPYFQWWYLEIYKMFYMSCIRKYIHKKTTFGEQFFSSIQRIFHRKKWEFIKDYQFKRLCIFSVLADVSIDEFAPIMRNLLKELEKNTKDIFDKMIDLTWIQIENKEWENPFNTMVYLSDIVKKEKGNYRVTKDRVGNIFTELEKQYLLR